MLATDGRPAPQGESPAFNLLKYLKGRQAQVEAALDISLPLMYPEQLYEAIRDALRAWGSSLSTLL